VLEYFRTHIAARLATIWLVVAIPMTVMVFATYGAWYTARQSIIEQQREGYAESTAKSFQLLLLKLRFELRTSGANLAEDGPPYRSAESVFSRIAAAFPVADVVLTDTRGRVLSASDADLVGRSLAQDAAFRVAMRAPDGSGIEPSEDASRGVVGFHVAQLIPARPGRPPRVMMALVDVRRLHQTFTADVPTGGISVVDSAGQVVFQNEDIRFAANRAQWGDKFGFVRDALRGQRATAGSRILEGFVSPYDAHIAERLRSAGALLPGKTNMDEFAMGGSTENSAFGITRNPWNLDCVPGGSSGGSATCVAAGQAPLAIGTDTGGSIRQPASFCGVVGLKPTYGRVSRYGLVAFASSLDQAGPFARTAEDAALLLEVMAGHDPRDSTSAPVASEKYSSSVRQSLQGFRVGVVREHFDAGLDSQVERSVRDGLREFVSLGAKLVDVSMPHSKYAVAVYYVIAPCEASSNLARYDGVHYGYRADERDVLAELQRERSAAHKNEELESPLVRLYRRTRTEGFGLEVKRRIMLGTFALSAGYQDRYYHKAQQARRLIRQDYDAVFKQCDVLAGPTTPTAAFRLGEKLSDPVSMYLGDLYTVGANLAGIPALGIPCGFTSSGLPIGIQLQGPAFAEERLLRIAYMFQTATDWHQRRPNVT
jgi:aspartyl-tRNA(Asn)/glutamyl-tRNA(Gln) amidotransferase subunit A